MQTEIRVAYQAVCEAGYQHLYHRTSETEGNLEVARAALKNAKGQRHNLREEENGTIRRIQIEVEEYGHAARAIGPFSTVAVLTALFTRHRQLLCAGGRDKVVESAIQTALAAVIDRPVARL